MLFKNLFETSPFLRANDLWVFYKFLEVEKISKNLPNYIPFILLTFFKNLENKTSEMPLFLDFIKNKRKRDKRIYFQYMYHSMESLLHFKYISSWGVRTANPDGYFSTVEEFLILIDYKKVNQSIFFKPCFRKKQAERDI